MAKVGAQLEQWQERGIQVMVLLSFTMQLMLLVLAEFRRRVDSRVLRAVIWSAYMLADSTAIYTLGHLSVTSRSGDHELMAFWAPFLLLHLGGQDNITAYAIEDNRLWLRHLQALIVQVAAAAYVLHESTVVGTQTLLRNASILVFTFGVVKYGERVWALNRANTSASGNKYRSFDRRTRSLNGPPTDQGDTEGLLRIAYLLLDVPKDLLQGPLPKVMVHLDDEEDFVPVDKLYKVVEMQLSLMHDVVYSKAQVVHTWYGLCIRMISPIFTAIAFVLFHRSGLSAGDRYSRADIVITYVLLGGAVTLEMVSVLRAMFSKWSSMVLGKLAYDAQGKERCMWLLLARAILYLRRFVILKRDGSRWWWSDSMRQHNLIDLCVRSRASKTSRIAGWMRIEDWWNTLVYSGSIRISPMMKELVVKQVLMSGVGNGEGYNHDKFVEEKPNHIINSRGRHALKRRGLYKEFVRFVNMELDESILVWHIATDVYLRCLTDQWQADADDMFRFQRQADADDMFQFQGQAHADDMFRLAKATEAISNYMLFLLVARPYMLPGSVSRPMYVDMCYCLTGLEYNTAKELTRLLMSDSPENIKDDTKLRRILENRTLGAARDLASMLVTPRYEFEQPYFVLKMLAEVWTEMLCYSGYKCSGYSHAKQLSNGGEFLTVAALVVEYYRKNVLKYPLTPLMFPFGFDSLEAPLNEPRRTSYGSDDEPHIASYGSLDVIPHA